MSTAEHGLPDTVDVGPLTFHLRKFQTGPGHDWLRMRSNGVKAANAEVNMLVDEIVRLRERIGETDG